MGDPVPLSAPTEEEKEADKKKLRQSWQPEYPKPKGELC